MRCARRLSGVVVVLGIWGQCALGGLSEDIRRVLSDKLLQRATVGVEVVQLGVTREKARVIFEQNGHTPLMPASNMKLLTTSAALSVLTPEFKFRTFFVKRGDDLIIWGDGDPTLGDGELMDQIGWSRTAVFEEWAGQLGKQQIQSVNNIFIDDSIFDEELLHPRWAKHQFEPSGAEVAGLNFGANIFEFVIRDERGGVSWTTRPTSSYPHVISNKCVGGKANEVLLARAARTNDITIRGTVARSCEVAVTVHDPAMYAGSVFAEVLRSKGIAVRGTVLRDRTTRSEFAAVANKPEARAWSVLCRFDTPLMSVISRCNKESMNLYAEALCKRMGAATSGGPGSWSNGTAATGRYLRQLGVAESEFALDDGCGLSRENKVTTNGIIQALLNCYYSPSKDAFVSTLPVGGVDGTLHKRFADSQLRGRVFAKTGFIANVSALSGFLETRSGQWYAFSILMNGIPDKSNGAIKPLQEKIVKAVEENTTEK